MSANDTQVAGNHYKAKAIQPWDYIISNDLGYLEGNVVKYVSRWRDKGGVDDLRKAMHYLQKLIEVAMASNVPVPAKAARATDFWPFPTGVVPRTGNAQEN